MKCEDVGMTSPATGNWDGRITRHEGMLSVGYEIRRLTGKLDLTGIGFAGSACERSP